MTDPELRPSPPWLMDDMPAAEPGLVRGVLERVDAAGAIARAIRDAGDEVVVTGCGTSEHGAMGIAELKPADALGPGVRARAVAAFEAALDPQRAGTCIAVSHEGSTEFTLQALAAARARGAVTALVTARPEAAAGVADHVLPTPVVDASWCHTVGYLSPPARRRRDRGGAPARAPGRRRPRAPADPEAR